MYLFNPINFLWQLFVEDLKQHAYENLKDLVPTDEPSFGGSSRSLSVQAVPCTCPTIDFQQHDLRVVLQGINEGISANISDPNIKDTSG